MAAGRIRTKAMANITYQDILGNNKDNLFKQYGMDPKGNNEGGAWARRIMQPVGAGLADQAIFAANELEPARQSAYRWLMSQLAPGAQEAQTATMQRQVRSKAGSAGRQSSAGALMHGLSPEYAQAILDSFNLAGTEGANDVLFSEQGRKNDAATAIAKMATQGQDAPLAQLFQMLFGDIEQRHQQNQAERSQGGLGGVLGTVGQLAGLASGFDWGSLFGGGGGASSLVPSGMTYAHAPGTFTFGVGRNS